MNVTGMNTAVITSVMILTFTMIPLAEWMGQDRTHGAVLQSAMSFSGMVGSVMSLVLLALAIDAALAFV